MVPSYLDWIARSAYPTFADFAESMIREGYRAGLSGVATARKMLLPGAVVFLAHDDCVTNNCPACVMEMECPRCKRLAPEIEKATKAIKGVTSFILDEKGDVSKNFLRERDRLHAFLHELTSERNHCTLCRGRGHGRMSSGGFVVRPDGTALDYVTYRHHQACGTAYALNVTLDHMCTVCRGSAELPDGSVRALFVPRVELVTNDADEAKRARGDGFVVEPESKKVKRGLYASARAGSGSTSRRLIRCVEHLEDSGVAVGTFEAVGDFAILKRPIALNGELRCPGLKRWTAPHKESA